VAPLPPCRVNEPQLREVGAVLRWLAISSKPNYWRTSDPRPTSTSANENELADKASTSDHPGIYFTLWILFPPEEAEQIEQESQRNSDNTSLNRKS
jgi:hypothetical protein